MLADTARFAALAGELAAGTPCAPRRARAVADYLGLLCDSIHHHHRIEDEVLWPTLTAAAGDAVDVRELTDDHAQLDPMLAEIRAACADLVARRPDAAGVLAERLTRLHTVLDEHIADEERTVFPIVAAYVTTAQWEKVEAAARCAVAAVWSPSRSASSARTVSTGPKATDPESRPAMVPALGSRS
ncbi:hemerythrin domain-containing protein [Nocardia rhizosphaerihabitans]|uniref:hemerythrin domain-containing protein n=1 Tax=Nocardia rhizosphaerihabitans TaxID=1691570 RepID=UPI00366E0CCA